MGDMVNRMPAINYLYDQTEHVRQYVFVHDYLYPLFQNVFWEKKDRIHLMPMSAHKGWLERDWCKQIPYVDFKPVQLSTSKPHLTEVGFLEILKRCPDKGDLWNIPRANLTNVDIDCYNISSKDYGVLQVSHTAPVRAWPTNEVEEVVRWMVNKKITPVLLGKSSSDLGTGSAVVSVNQINSSNLPNEVVDLRDKTDVLQALKVIDNAKFIAGVDGGLINLAYMTDTPVVVGFTSIKPNARVPFRNGKQFDRTIVIEPEKQLECRFCETLQPYVVYNSKKGPIPHDYKKCLYKDYKCVRQMTAAKFIRGIKEVLNFKGLGSRQGKWSD